MLIAYVVRFAVVPGALIAMLALLRNQPHPSTRVVAGIALGGVVIGFGLAVLLAGGTFERLLS